MNINFKGNTLYYCDGNIEKCRKTGCYKNGGDCRLTRDVSHSIGEVEWNGKYIGKYEAPEVKETETQESGAA